MKAILFANTDWYLYNFRLSYARYLRDLGWEVVLMTPEGNRVSEMEEAGFRHIPFNFSRKGINPLAELRTILRIKEIYREEKPDLVHHFTIKCDIYGSLAACANGVRGIVNSITGLGYLFISKNPFVMILRPLIYGLYRKALAPSQVIFENPDDAALFLKHGLIRENHYAVISGTGVDINAFTPSEEKEEPPIITLPSRMLWDKGIGEFVKAAGEIHKKGIPARFVLAGNTDPGNPASIPAEQLQKWHDEGIIEYWGWQENMRDLFARSAIICLPSYREGLPRTLIEASACGRPIVTTDVPGCREAVEDGMNGILVPPKDAESLEKALLCLIRDKNLRQEMGAAGRKMAEEIFALDIINRETWKICRKALGEETA